MSDLNLNPFFHEIKKVHLEINSAVSDLRIAAGEFFHWKAVSMARLYAGLSDKEFLSPVYRETKQPWIRAWNYEHDRRFLLRPATFTPTNDTNLLRSL